MSIASVNRNAPGDVAATRCKTMGTNARGAFTLLEIMLAVGILAMMSLAIYRFVQTNIVAMNVSAAADAVDARYTGLRQMLTQELQSLPQGTGALLGDAVKLNDSDRDVMTWVCTAGPGVLTRYAPGDFKVDLRLRPHAAKSTQLDLGILRRPDDDEDETETHETWVGLINDVTSLQIRYFDPRLNAWVQRWTDTITLPRLVRLVIGRRDAKVPEEIVVPLARTAL
jgi:prepilin-type N-terminal cleavage/methylation domain-containing protein